MKKIVFGLIVLVVLYQVVGCGSKGNVNKKEIQFMDLGTVEEMKRMAVNIKEFEKIHPDIKVKVEYVPGAGPLFSKILGQTASGTMSDVVYINDTAFPALVEQGVFASMDELIENDKEFDISDFYESALKFCKYKGKLYFLPPQFGTIILFYNKDLFKSANVPFPYDGWTWEEFRDACIKLTRDTNNDGKIDQFAVAGWGLWSWVPMILQNGGHIVNEDKTKCLMDSPEVIEALQFVVDLYNKDKVIVSESIAPSLVSMGASMMMSAGKSAMLPSGLASYKDFEKINWDIVAPPEKKGKRRVFHGGCWAYGIANSSKYKNESWKLVKYLTGKEVLKRDLKFLDLPARKSLEKDFLNSMPGKHLESYIYCVKYPNYETQLKKYSQVLSVLGDELEPYFFGYKKGDLKKLCKDITKKIDKILSEK